MSETFRAFEVWLLREHGDRAEVRKALQEFKHALAEVERLKARPYAGIGDGDIAAVLKERDSLRAERRTLAERVKEACAEEASFYRAPPSYGSGCCCDYEIARAIRALDLEPLLAPEETP